jgi:hypothetical protein
MERPYFFFVTKLICLFYRHLAVNGGNGCVKNKMLKNDSILVSHTMIKEKGEKGYV